jgi:4-amino-4-deoxy-L-arabinose transferase-like glycosyltransferase
MKAFGIIVAIICILLGWWTASLPDPSQRVLGKIVAVFGVAILLLSLLGRERITAFLLIGTAILLLIAYMLPMSFWQSVGLAERSDRE